jgi:hypothetical protein
MDKTEISKFIEDGYKKGRTVKVIPSPIPSRRQYDEKIVAWFDILGMRHRIHDYKKHDAEEILTTMGRFQNYVKNSCEDYEIKFMQISDGFILVSEFEQLKEICEILCQIQWKILVNDKMLLRGALTSGKISMTDDEQKLVVGPAFIEAFSMESENAIFPRIIVSSELYRTIKFDYLVEDSDHLYFLNFLDYVIKTENYNIRQLTHILQTTKVIDFLQKEYNENIKDNIKVAQKYGWLIEKLSTKKVKVL